MNYKYKLSVALNRIGIDLRRYPGREVRNRCRLLETYKINTVFDVGANVGQYAVQLRKSGYERRIVSFEPLSDAYCVLRTAKKISK